MTKRIYANMEQGDDGWLKVRCGKLTASKLGSILTPKTFKLGAGAKTQALIIAAERIKGVAEEVYISADMERGNDLEAEAAYLYNNNYQHLYHVGFIENDRFGFPFGASPDGLTTDKKGGIEIKCPRSQHHLNNILHGEIDPKYILQMHGVMMAGDLEYMDFISYHEGLKMKPIRFERDENMINIIVEVACQFEAMVQDFIEQYNGLDGLQTKLPKEINDEY